MDFFTTRNVVIVALSQTGVIVIGVLAAGTACRWHTEFNAMPPRAATLMAEYGFLALAVPVVWVIVAMRAKGRNNWPEDTQMFVLYSGLFLLLLLLFFAVYAGVLPWCRLVGL
jgi:hypothetical protein